VENEGAYDRVDDTVEGARDNACRCTSLRELPTELG
jgi:hypothetical protein